MDRDGEHPICRAHQPAGEVNPFGLVGVEEAVRGAPIDDGGNLPRQVHRVADAGVHALGTDRAVDMGRISHEEGTALPEPAGHAMVHVVGGEPVDLGDRELQVLDGPIADVVKGQFMTPVGQVLTYGAHQADAPRFLQRKDRQEVGFVEIDMEFVIGGRALRLDIGDVEEPGIRAAVEVHAERPPDCRIGAVAAGKERDVADLLRAVRAPKRRVEAVGILVEPGELRPPLDIDPQGVQAFDEQSLVGVLRKDQDGGKGGESLSEVPKRKPRGPGTSDPEIDAPGFDAVPGHRIRDPDLAVELERARLDAQGTGGGSRLGILVDDPYPDTEPREPQGERQAGGTGADDEHARSCPGRWGSHPGTPFSLSLSVRPLSGQDGSCLRENHTADRCGALSIDIRPAGRLEEGRSSDPEDQRLTDDRQGLEPRLGIAPAALADLHQQGGEVIDGSPYHAAVQDVERHGRLHLLPHDEARPGLALGPDDDLEEVVDDRKDRPRRSLRPAVRRSQIAGREESRVQVFADLIGDVADGGQVEALLAAVVVRDR